MTQRIRDAKSVRCIRSFIGGTGAKAFVVFGILAGVSGCVERTVTINTEPQGATVLLNDQEVGKSPVKVAFTWYGDYDVIVRKPGFQTVKTHERIRTPWYQYPVIDLITECLIPVTIHDDRVLETLVLQPQVYPTNESLLQSADAMRAEASE
jgi:hypothetical protein